MTYSSSLHPNVVIRFGEKVKRAGEHLKSLDDSAKRFAENQGNAGVLCVGEPNTQRTKYLLRIHGPVKFPEAEWGVIIGDAVHCLRSALDQLVSALWIDAPTRGTQFPVCLTEKEWIVEAPRMYWSVPPAYVAVLNAAQPYHRGDAAKTHPFAVLNALWNLDKHRAIPAAALLPRRVIADVIKKEGVTLGEFRPCTQVALKHNAVIAEAKLGPDGTGMDPKVRVNAQLTVNVGFGTIVGASSISHKPVGEVFKDLLLPAIGDVLRSAMEAKP